VHPVPNFKSQPFHLPPHRKFHNIITASCSSQGFEDLHIGSIKHNYLLSLSHMLLICWFVMILCTLFCLVIVVCVLTLLSPTMKCMLACVCRFQYRCSSALLFTNVYYSKLGFTCCFLFLFCTFCHVSFATLNETFVLCLCCNFYCRFLLCVLTLLCRRIICIVGCFCATHNL